MITKQDSRLQVFGIQNDKALDPLNLFINKHLCNSLFNSIKIPSRVNINSKKCHKFLSWMCLAVSYQKFKEKDFDGEFSFSNIEAVKPLTDNEVFAVYPNPANDQLNVFFNSAVDSKVQLQARDLSGKVVVEEARTIQQGNNTITLEGLSLPSGVYFLQVVEGNTIRVAKFLIHKD